MSEQNRYRIEYNFQRATGVWRGWTEAGRRWEMADTWQNAIHQWVDDMGWWWHDECQVVSETPSEDGRSGIIETQVALPSGVVGANFKATLD